MEESLLEDGFLAEDREVTLDVPTSKVDHVKNDLARLRRPPDETTYESRPNERTEVRVTFYRGTPNDLYQQLVKRLADIEQHHQ
jgi:hypothetical protein